MPVTTMQPVNVPRLRRTLESIFQREPISGGMHTERICQSCGKERPYRHFIGIFTRKDGSRCEGICDVCFANGAPLPD
jgi:uncharacterized protein CbrC (UPF0167 family)